MSILGSIGDALALAATKTWQITWSLILGFTLSVVIQAVVRRKTIVQTLGDDRPVTLAKAAGLGAATSSCSYAPVALARSLFRKGASLTSAMVFEITATNLVIELGIILALLISRQFTLAEFVGGPIMIVLLALAFRLFVRRELINAAREQANKGWAGSMEGHAGMDMSAQGDGSFASRLFSRDGSTAVSPRYDLRAYSRAPAWTLHGLGEVYLQLEARSRAYAVDGDRVLGGTVARVAEIVADKIAEGFLQRTDR